MSAKSGRSNVMCAVIGAIIKEPDEEDLETLEKVFLESSIRGLHATGISCVQNNKIVTKILPFSALEFFSKTKLSDFINEDGNLYLIGHCRYSTSDIEYNQPIFNETKSIVHNGVITQEPPERWNQLFSINCSGKNDSELLLHTDNPLRTWEDSSLSVCELYSDKVLKFYSNDKRPLWFTKTEESVIVVSTLDIGKRSGLDSLEAVIPMRYYEFDINL